MLVNYLKLALKVLARRKFFTAISLFGVAFTLMMVLLVTTVIDHVLSPRAPEVNLDRTLHLSFMISKSTRGENSQESWTSPGYGLLDRYARELPGVERMAIVSNPGDATSFVGGEKMTFKVRTADAAYWTVLDFDFIEGGPFTDRDDAEGNRVAVINEATRHRVFGGRTAVGESIDLDGRDFRVVGVVKDVDLARLTAFGDVWTPHGARRSADYRTSLSGGFSGLLLAESDERFDEIRAEFTSRIAHVEPDGDWESVTVLALPRTRFQEMALNNKEEDVMNPPVHLLIWQYIGGVLLWMLLPAINLVSINMSRIIERSSEIGVRKAFGASTGHLVGQFIVENILLCLIGAGLALVGAVVLIQMIQSSGLLPTTDVQLSYRVFFYALGFACLFGVLSGAVPAWRMSRLHPVDALRGGAR